MLAECYIENHPLTELYLKASGAERISARKAIIESLPNNARFFDFLIHQEDRTLNFGLLSDGKVVLYDNENTFSPASSFHLNIDDVSKFIPDSYILEIARKLTMEDLRGIKYLTPKQKQALLDRRDKLIGAIDEYLLKEHGTIV